MPRWQVILGALLDDVRAHPGYWSLVAYASAILAVDTMRERSRVRSMLTDLERDMTERADEIAARMDRATTEEWTVPE